MFPEVRYPEDAMRTCERALEARKVVEIALHHLGAERSECSRSRGVDSAADGAHCERACRVCEDSSDETSTLCARGAENGDELGLVHMTLLVNGSPSSQLQMAAARAHGF